MSDVFLLILRVYGFILHVICSGMQNDAEDTFLNFTSAYYDRIFTPKSIILFNIY